MAYKRFRILSSKLWAMTVCAISVAVLTLMGSCRSKKVTKAPDVPETEETVDAKTVTEMQVRVESLKNELDERSRSLIYGPPEVMEQRARENRRMREEIDSLENVIKRNRK